MRGWDKTPNTHISQLWRTHHTSSLKPGFHCESSLVPRPSPKSGKRVWFLSDISEQHFLSYQVRSPHEDCPNCILCPGFKFSDGLDCSCNDLKKLNKTVKSFGTGENKLPSKFIVSPIRFKIQSVMSCAYNYKFCNLIRALGSE